MSDRPLKLYFDDIIEAINKIEEYTREMTFENFKNDTKTIDAVVRNIEVIGEAAKHIPADIRVKHIEIPWKEIIGTRSKVIHEYFGVDVEILWKTITEDIPLLKKQISDLKY